jgi:tryptophan synthase alpha chain
MKRLSIYLMAGRRTPELAQAAVAGGADLLEIGFPFSDPLADGPVLRIAAERALANGMHTAACLECLAAVRRRVDVPLVVMTYSSVLEAYGYGRFAADALGAGAASLIVADLPLEGHPELGRIHLVAPTTNEERIRRAGELTDGWLYLVRVTGTTGYHKGVVDDLATLVRRARAVTGVPLLAGFGISTPAEAARAASLADGIVVGTHAVQIAEEGGSAALQEYVASLRTAITACEAAASGDNAHRLRTP